MPANLLDYIKLDFQTIDPETPLEEIERLMSDHGIRHVPVLSEGMEPVGIISDRDCLRGRKLMARGDFSGNLLARDIMTPNPITVAQEEPFKHAVDHMIEKKIHCVLICDGGTVVGIVTAWDVLVAYRDEMR